ncbi:unnamed protein product [Absidia cylindrospora]
MNSVTKTQYLGTLVENIKFCRKNLDDNGDLFDNEVFINCISECMCNRSIMGEYISARNLRKSTIALAFVIMLLKLRIASGDDKQKEYMANHKCDYWKVYKELIASEPRTKLARKLAAPEVLPNIQARVVEKGVIPVETGPSSLNDFLVDSDED